MIRIAICDDEKIEIERTRDLLSKYMMMHPQYDISCHEFRAPLELLSTIATKGGFEVLILDIYMAGMLGTQAAKELRQIGVDSEVIFVTSSRDHAIEAFEVDAAQYLIKPVSEAAFFSALDRVMLRINTERRAIITLKTSEGIARLAIRDVVFTETGRNNYQIVHTIQGKKLEVRMTATELFEILDQNKLFVRCGASINLNLKFIRQISKESITFDTGEHLNYPYRVHQKLKEAFLRFQMENED